MKKTSRKVTFGGACSLDGFFARKNDAVDWLMWSPEAGKIMSDYWKTIDTIVMGRRTYEAALKMTGGKENLYAGIKSYVFSRTLKPAKKATEIAGRCHEVREAVEEDQSKDMRMGEASGANSLKPD